MLPCFHGMRLSVAVLMGFVALFVAGCRENTNDDEKKRSPAPVRPIRVAIVDDAKLATMVEQHIPYICSAHDPRITLWSFHVLFFFFFFNDLNKLFLLTWLLKFSPCLFLPLYWYSF